MAQAEAHGIRWPKIRLEMTRFWLQLGGTLYGILEPLRIIYFIYFNNLHAKCASVGKVDPFLSWAPSSKAGQ